MGEQVKYFTSSRERWKSIRPIGPTGRMGPIGRMGKMGHAANGSKTSFFWFCIPLSFVLSRLSWRLAPG